MRVAAEVLDVQAEEQDSPAAERLPAPLQAPGLLRGTGVHHDAHMFSTTGAPRRSGERRSWTARSAAPPSAPSRAGTAPRSSTSRLRSGRRRGARPGRQRLVDAIVGALRSETVGQQRQKSPLGSRHRPMRRVRGAAADARLEG